MSNYTASVDAFGRLRVSQPATLFDSKQLINSRTDIFDDEEVSGGGTATTYDSNNAQTIISVSASTAGKRVRQTFRRMGYQPGKSQRAFYTGIMGTTQSGVTKRIGSFDDDNGYFFQHDGDGWAIGIRKAGVDAIVRQADWNQNNFCSRDPEACQIMTVDFEWLGVGIVRFGFQEPEGNLTYVHVFKNPGRIQSVYTSNPNLPVRYEIEADGTNAGADSMSHICCSVETEAGREFTGQTRHADRGITTLQTGNNTSIYPLLAIRLKSTHAPYAIVQADHFSVFNQDKNFFRAGICVNPTVAGTALSFTDGDVNQAVEVAKPTNATTLTDTGMEVEVVYGESDASGQAQGSDLSEPLQLGVAIDGTSDIFVVFAQNQVAGANDYLATIGWREEF